MSRVSAAATQNGTRLQGGTAARCTPRQCRDSAPLRSPRVLSITCSSRAFRLSRRLRPLSMT